MYLCLTTTLMSAEKTLSPRPVAERAGAPAEYHYRFFRSIEAAGRHWDQAAPPDLFLQRPYLSLVEKTPPKGMRFGYLVFYCGDLPIGVALCQIKYFKADENIQEDAPKDPCFFTNLGRWFKKQVSGWVAADILICGNMLLTGEHGFYFNENYITPAESSALLEKALVEVVKTLDQSNIKIPVILIKDVAPRRELLGDQLETAGFTEFCIQPNMVMELPFHSFEEYMAAMSTKYRTRAKRAFKKMGALERKELSLADIQQQLPRIYELYREIARNAGFNMVDLNEQYLYALKRDLGDYFRIFGYYQGEQLLAFYTTIQNGTELEAHFLGYDKEQNHEHQLYLNMLYDMIRIGIEAGCHEIIFARTALEIKSSVGAVAHDLHCYLRHQNSFANRFAEPMIDYLNPVEVWQPRHPFRDEASAHSD